MPIPSTRQHQRRATRKSVKSTGHKRSLLQGQANRTALQANFTTYSLSHSGILSQLRLCFLLHTTRRAAPLRPVLPHRPEGTCGSQCEDQKRRIR